jgi:hypothetical protein
MPRWFNTTGPCRPELHYMLSPTARLPDLTRLIDQQQYFVLHAPRQTGKTTAMLALAQSLTAAGTYTAVVLTMEVGAAFNDDPGAAERAILADWSDAATWQLPAALHPPTWPAAKPGARRLSPPTDGLSLGTRPDRPARCA